MKKKTIFISATIIILLGIMTLTLANNKKALNKKKEAVTSQSEIAVTVATTEFKETNGSLQLVGATQPSKEVNVASESSGKIVEINFKMGDYVTAGKVLAKTDDTFKRLAYENANLNFKKFKDDYERYQNLRSGDAVSETQLRDIKLGFENAKIQLENAKKQWDDTKIKAPFSGYITSQNTELGAYLNVGSVVAGMADISSLKVVLEVSESNAYLLHEGQQIQVTADVYPDALYNGKISTISPQASASHTYPVEVQIANNTKDKLKAGTYVNVSVSMSKSGKGLMIPRNAIVSSVKDPSVYVLAGNTAKLVKITTGRSFNTDLEVLAGLKEGEKVVTSGQINLSDGAKVAVIN